LRARRAWCNTSQLANRPIPLLADVPGGSPSYTGSSLKHRHEVTEDMNGIRQVAIRTVDMTIGVVGEELR
jgi:hypothetical protein